MARRPDESEQGGGSVMCLSETVNEEGIEMLGQEGLGAVGIMDVCIII
jgi:hypothetical protein